MRTITVALRRVTAVLILTVGVIASWAGSAYAQRAGSPDSRGAEPRVPRCLEEVELESFTATPNRLDYAELGRPVVLAWSVKVPARCTTLKFTILGLGRVQPHAQRTIFPRHSSFFQLSAQLPGKASKELGGVGVYVVQLPRRCDAVMAPPPASGARPPVASERPCGEVTITSSDMRGLFRQAIATENTVVRIADHVRLDLSNHELLPVASRVLLIGGRTARQPGGLLFSKTRPSTLFAISGDGVRITGLRIQGPDMGVPSGDGNKGAGIAIRSNIGVEIDNNELSGWTNSAVVVRDPDNRIGSSIRPAAVHIHDNFIHHNQHVGRMGYGVSVKDDAFALIERNVFDNNRHAIEGDGSTYSGYWAYDNLVLPDGGRHRWIPFPGFWWHTHQFDMHGQRHCGWKAALNSTVDALPFVSRRQSLYNCGRAGQRVDIRYNSFLYTKGNAVKIRGVPLETSHVSYNVFAHESLDDAVQPDDEPRVRRHGNRLGVNSLKDRLACDVDRDGTTDWLLTTGQTWWYSSAQAGPWVFIRRSTERRTSCA